MFLSVLIERSVYHPAHGVRDTHDELSDAEIAAVFRDIIAGAGRYPRHTELQFTTFCAEHFVDGLRLAGLPVIRPDPLRLTE